MALNIATDTAFLLASKSSDRNTVTLNQSMERLTSGLRINSASDDAQSRGQTLHRLIERNGISIRTFRRQ